MNNSLIIFIKNPILGKVKTRIGKKLGNKVALDLYNKLIKRCQIITKDIKYKKIVYYSDFIDSNDGWDNFFYTKRLQCDYDLGQRMITAFEETFNDSSDRVVLIGSDIYSLTTEIINDAFNYLIKSDVVIGPTFDGGYYLIGLKKTVPEIFSLKKWSTETVFEETITLIRQQNLTVSKTIKLNDIDEVDDLKGTELEYFLNVK